MKNLKNIYFFREESFDIAFARFHKSSKLIIKDFLRNKSKRLDSSNYSYRAVNNWKKNNLFYFVQSDTTWVKYSPLDVIWIQIISELRTFGVSLDNIKKVRNALIYNENGFNPFFEFYVAAAIVSKKDVIIWVLSDFQSHIGTRTEIESTQSFYRPASSIHISLNEVLSRVFPNADFKPQARNITQLNEEELNLLFEIRMGGFDSIQIKLRDGKISRIDKTHYVPEKKLFKLLNSKEYDTITVHRENGNVVSVSQTIKKKS